MKKVSLILVIVVLSISILFGAKKKNSNKYIFLGGSWIAVFDGETKRVERKKIKRNMREKGISYFPKSKKIVWGLTSIDVNNLNNSFNGDISKLRKTDKIEYGLATHVYKYGGSPNKVIFSFFEWDYDEGSEKYYENPIPEKDILHKRTYIWDIVNNVFQLIPRSSWNALGHMNDQYPVYNSSFGFKFNMVTEENLNKIKQMRRTKQTLDGKKLSKDKKRLLARKVFKRGLKFKNLLKREKIAIGDYTDSSIENMSFMVTGGRYIAVLNDKLYLVHMKTKKVYTLIPEKQNIDYFIIEKNEDDVDLDAE